MWILGSRGRFAWVGALLLVAACREAGPSNATETTSGGGAPRAAATPAKTPRTADGYEVVLADPKAGAERPPSTPAALRTTPTSPDPEAGEFTLEEAVEGLPPDGKLVAEIRTDLGTLHCDLFADRAPRTVANFVGLSRGKRPWWDAVEGAWATKPFYDGTTFHRVIPGFMIQGGDRLGTGTGGVGYVFDDEVHPTLKHDRAGQLCMANRGKNTNGGQFFITDGAAPHLDAMASFTIFGQCAPAATVARIARVPQAGAPTNRPLTAVVMDAVRILRHPGGAEGAAKAAP